MVKRLFALVIALAIASAPAALEACQIGCASISVHQMAAHDAHLDHQHHGAAGGGLCHEPSATHQHLSSQAPPCEHDGKATVVSVTAARPSDGALLYAAAAPSIADVVFASALTVVPTSHSPLPDRLGIRLASPLRV
jgi:hypothetical protein